MSELREKIQHDRRKTKSSKIQQEAQRSPTEREIREQMPGMRKTIHKPFPTEGTPKIHVYTTGNR